MGPKMYFVVDAKRIYLIDYILTDEEIYSRKYNYPIPNRTYFRGNDSSGIFNECGVPEEFQCLIMESNFFAPITILSSPSTNRRKNVFQRFKAKELLTEMPINLSISGVEHIRVYGSMASELPPFEVDNCYNCKRHEVIEFYEKLRECGLMDNYLMALFKIMGIKIKSDIDSTKINKKAFN